MIHELTASTPGMQSEWRKNPQPAGLLLLCWPVFLSMGIGSFFLMDHPPVWWTMPFLLLGIIGVALATKRLRYETWWVWIMHGLFAFALGFCLIQFCTAMVNVSPLYYPEYNVPVSGVITHAEFSRGGWRLVLDDATVTKPEKYQDREPRNYRLRVTVRSKNFKPEMGSRIALKASLIAPSPPLLPGMFDFRRHAFYQEFSGYGYSNSPVTVIEQPEHDRYWLEDYRHFLGRRITALLKQTSYEPQVSVIGVTQAFLNGQRAGIDKQTEKDLQRSGLQHLISISGVHVSLLAGIVFFTVRFLLALSMRLALSWPIKKIAAFVALLAILFYMAVIGLSAPTVRSVLTTGIVLIAVMLDREAITLRLVALAALMILIVEPESLITPGFQMSFAAVIALVVFYQKTMHFWQKPFWRDGVVNRLLFVLCGSIATSLVASTATAPFVLYHFQQLPLLSVVANLLVTPLMAFVVMPASLLAYLTLPFDMVGSWAMLYMGWGIEKILQIAHWTAGQNVAVWRMRGLMNWQIVLISLGLLWILLQSGRYVWFGLLPIAIAFAGLFVIKTPVLALIPTSSRTVIYAPADETVVYYDGRMDKFTQDLLTQFLTKERAEPLPEGKLPSDIYIARDIPELDKICDRPETMIISRWYIDQRCKGKTIIDRNSLKRAKTGIVILEN